MTELVLASKSASRRAILDGAGVPYRPVSSGVDEGPIKAAELARKTAPAEIALTLAEAKAAAVKAPGALVLGADQVLEFRGRLYDKPASREEAADRLSAMAGQPHYLRNGMVLMKDGEVVWRYQGTAKLTMRPLRGDEIDSYLASAGDAITETVGAYALEATGARLFERIEGDYFTILGLPLFPLLPQLRAHGVISW